MRLIDLHVDWLLQYAGESTVFDPADFPGIADWVGQAEGYLGAASAGFAACFRTDADWARRADPWAALDELVTRIEAEFPGRVLRDPSDILRWNDDPEGLTWAVIGVEGFDRLVRSEADLARLPDLLRRGVRLFQPTYTASSGLAGSSSPGDDRGLLDLGRRFLETLAELSGSGSATGRRPRAPEPPGLGRGPRLVRGRCRRRARRLVPVYSHGFLARPGLEGPRGLGSEGLARLRALGGVVGLTPAFLRGPAGAFRQALESAAALPFLGRAGYEGLGIGTDFLGVDRNPPGLGSAHRGRGLDQFQLPAGHGPGPACGQRPAAHRTGDRRPGLMLTPAGTAFIVPGSYRLISMPWTTHAAIPSVRTQKSPERKTCEADGAGILAWTDLRKASPSRARSRPEEARQAESEQERGHRGRPACRGRPGRVAAEGPRATSRPGAPR